MKRLAVAASAALALAAAVAPAAHAQPAGEHNCAGVITSGAAGPGFGRFVAAGATVEPRAIPVSFDLANCGRNGQPTE